MPLNRRYAAKRKLIRRKRWAGRLARSRVPKTLRQPIQYFKRSAYFSGWAANNTTADNFLVTFATLNSVPNASDFTTLYDQFRINGVKFTLIPRGNQSDIGTASGTVAQSVGVFSVIDYDDSNALTSLGQALQYQNMKMTRSHQIHSRYFKPRIMTSADATTGIVMANNTRGWLDVATGADVKHLGIKYVLQQSPNSSQQFDLKVDYYLAFKCVR